MFTKAQKTLAILQLVLIGMSIWQTYQLHRIRVLDKEIYSLVHQYYHPSELTPADTGPGDYYFTTQ